MRKLWFVLVEVIIAAVIWSSLRSGELRKDTARVSNGGIMAAGFEGGGKWLNSEPLTLVGLLADKKAILVDFWTYSCINCQRTIPYLRSWWEKYEDKGLVIIGVHSPEFEFEKETANVEMAIAKYGVKWPVVQDNEMKIWRAYANNYWPHKYLINRQGNVVYDHIGEGGYEETEKKIQELLQVSVVIEVTDEVTQDRNQTPELYVNKRGNDQAKLVGEWVVTDDYAQAGSGAKLKLEYQAGEMNLVMSGQGEVRYMIDGEERVIAVTMDDLYKLWSGEFGKHVLEMQFDPGVRVHAFTFGK